MKKKRLLIKLKKLVKIFVLYTMRTIIRFIGLEIPKLILDSLCKKGIRVNGDIYLYKKIRLFLIIIWEWDMDVIVSTLQSDY